MTKPTLEGVAQESVDGEPMERPSWPAWWSEAGGTSSKVVPDVKARTLLPMIQEHIPTGQTVYTDEMLNYNRLSSLGYMHETVKHSAKQYVAGRAHTNNIEGIWSNSKRGIDGVHHRHSTSFTEYRNSSSGSLYVGFTLALV